jgi:uncharacterized protein (TIGR01615 family)
MEAILRFLLHAREQEEPTQHSRALPGFPPSKPTMHGTSEECTSPRGKKANSSKDKMPSPFLAPQALADKTNAYQEEGGGVSNKLAERERKMTPAAPLSIPAARPSNRHQIVQQDHSSSTSPLNKASLSTAISYEAEAVIERIRQLSLPSSSLEALVSEECRRFASSQKESSGPPPILAVGDLASFLAKRFPSSRFFLRKVTDSKQYWTKSMTNIFIICINSTHSPQHILIDPSFKSSFLVGGGLSERYSSIYSALPDIFIGSSSTLSALLHIICFEAIKMFEIQGKPTPPWRGFNNQIARWHSDACKDTLVSPWPSHQGQDQASAISRAQSTSLQQVVKVGAMKQDFKLIQGFDLEHS